MNTITGLLYSSATLVATGNSGWLPLPNTSQNTGVLEAGYSIVPADLAGDETMDVVLETAVTAAGLGAVTSATFTQIDSGNTPETKAVAVPTGGFYKLTWTLAGTTKSMSFDMYYVMRV